MINVETSSFSGVSWGVAARRTSKGIDRLA
jgi:hypothetical protein